MVLFALGLGVLAMLLWSAGAFASADVRTVRQWFGWVAALGGLLLGAMLLLTGRGAAALSAAVLLGPLAWGWWQDARAGTGRGRPGTSSRMGRAEALSVLGLAEGADDAAVRAAWMAMMRKVHPDGGGTAWMAARVNEARDVLLKRR